MEDKRLIEVDFPLKEVSEESAREKSIRHGHISTLHIWWARRPLASSRATTFAALIPSPQNHDGLRKKLEFVIELSKWGNSLNKRLTENAKKEIRDCFDGRPPKVLDCFAGGGALSLEALRLGCETYALEYNPVAVLILKSVLEYPQKFGKRKACLQQGLRSAGNSLVEDVNKWGNWVLEEAKKEIKKFYPEEPDGSIPVGYIWARTVQCPNPSCKAEIPLLRQFWLARSQDQKVALKMVVDKKRREISYEVLSGKKFDFDPSQGTTSRATVLCPVCGAGIAGKTLRQRASEGQIGEKLIVVITHHPNSRGKHYRVASPKADETFNLALN